MTKPVRAPRIMHNPLEGEAPVQALDSFLTPADVFFVRSHFPLPQHLPAEWTVRIHGEVESPIAFTLDQIRELGGVARPVTLECAGNGRSKYPAPTAPGAQWRYGAVSNAEWTGVPLASLLELAGLKTSALHIWTEALDGSSSADAAADDSSRGSSDASSDASRRAGAGKFLRSIPRAAALDVALVAYEMNGAPIPLVHGGPLRLVLPGWYGMASTKWLTGIDARAVESDNHFMADAYRLDDGTPLQEMRVKSVIVTPLADEAVPAGRVVVKGQAWTGASGGGIRAVDVSVDGGQTWNAARLLTPVQQGAWQSWEAEVTVGAGEQAVMARATDNSGAVQPRAAEKNAGGYGNNGIQTVRFRAVGN